jgi:two-component system, cell cycle sensor histidine kinase and response regulator CckA
MELPLTRDALESRLEYLEEVNRFTIDALEMAASLGDFQSSLQNLDEPHAILEEMGSRIKRLIPFDVIAFYLVDEVTSDFYLGSAQPPDQQDEIKQEVEFLIDNGTFAWALRENRAVLISTRDFQRKLVLHAMTTVARTRGMFVGMLPVEESNIPGVSIALLSIILLNSANALESFELYRMIQNARDQLEIRVKERTIELAQTNEKMQVEIAERRRTEEALRKSEERFRELYHNAPVGYHELDIEGRITNVNHTELEMMGYTHDEMLGQTLWTFDVEEETARQQVLALLAGKSPSAQDRERTFRRKDGTIFPVLIEDRLLRNEEGKIVGIRSTIQDITERKQADEKMLSLQEQLRQSQKMEAVGRLAGGIAHDFNNLLTVIHGHCEISLLQLQGNNPLREDIVEIKKAGDRAANLTRQLLAFSRRQIMEMKVIDVNFLLRELEKMLRRVMGEDIELVTVLDDHLGKIKMDPGQMEQVVLNLAINARDAMPSGGTFVLETTNVHLDDAYARAHISVEPGHYVMLSVTDTGSGMSPQVKERLFEPFFTTKEKGKGTGLGLSTVYGIMKQSGGNIWVYSEPGHGTTFRIYMPRVDQEADSFPRRDDTVSMLYGNETILLAEDEPSVRGLAARVLRNQGYSVLEAVDGGEALQIASRHKERIDLLLTDVVMPQMGGKELYDQLKPLRPHLKVLFTSGYTENAIVHQGELTPGIAFLQKPFSPIFLTHKVREILDQ